MPVTHEVSNQAEPLADSNLFAGHRALQDALAHHHPAYDRARFKALGAEVGSGAMQSHARLANQHAPVLHTHDAQGRRSDHLVFHPTYHVPMAAALRSAAPPPKRQR